MTKPYHTKFTCFTQPWWSVGSPRGLIFDWCPGRSSSNGFYIKNMVHHFPGMDSNRFLMTASSIFLLARSLDNGRSADFKHLKRLEI